MESVAGCALRGHQQRPGCEITLGWARRPDANHAFGHLCGETFSVRFGDRGDSFNSQTLTGSNNADGDLAPVGDQYPGYAHGFTRKSVCPYSTNWPFWATT